MENLRLNKAVRSVVILRPDPSSGSLTPTVLYKTAGKKKKSSKNLRPLEKAERRYASAQRAYWDDYLKRHQRSNQKSGDGWIRDFITNVSKASRKSAKVQNKGM